MSVYTQIGPARGMIRLCGEVNLRVDTAIFNIATHGMMFHHHGNLAVY
jgi:hypothetical protein